MPLPIMLLLLLAPPQQLAAAAVPPGGPAPVAADAAYRLGVNDELQIETSDPDSHLDVMLRLADGYEAGATYLPVVVLGRDHYAFLQFSIVDALRRTVYSDITLQLGPDERYPWASNETDRGKAERDDEEVAEVEEVEAVAPPPAAEPVMTWATAPSVAWGAPATPPAAAAAAAASQPYALPDLDIIYAHRFCRLVVLDVPVGPLSTKQPRAARAWP